MGAVVRAAAAGQLLANDDGVEYEPAAAGGALLLSTCASYPFSMDELLRREYFGKVICRWARLLRNKFR